MYIYVYICLSVFRVAIHEITRVCVHTHLCGCIQKIYLRCRYMLGRA